VQRGVRTARPSQTALREREPEEAVVGSLAGDGGLQGTWATARVVTVSSLSGRKQRSAGGIWWPTGYRTTATLALVVYDRARNPLCRLANQLRSKVVAGRNRKQLNASRPRVNDADKRLARLTVVQKKVQALGSLPLAARKAGPIGSLEYVAATVEQPPLNSRQLWRWTCVRSRDRHAWTREESWRKPVIMSREQRRCWV